jgi:phage-related protein
MDIPCDHFIDNKYSHMKIRVGSDIYRIFCFFDKGNLIILLNGFQKKSERTPKNEIEKANRLKRKYYEEQ